MSEQRGQQGGAPALLQAVGVRKHFKSRRSEVEVLSGLDLEVQAGDTISIRGASGAGKSTLLHLLGGLECPTQGEVFLEGEDLYHMRPGQRSAVRATRFGFVFQSYHLLPELDIIENVMLPAMSRERAVRRASEHRQRALELLGRVGLGDRATHLPSELSGGEQQRAALARALMNDPEVILADEPTGNLDAGTGGLVLEYLFGLTVERGHTLILVTHNEAVAEQCERRLTLRDGRLAL